MYVASVGDKMKTGPRKFLLISSPDSARRLCDLISAAIPRAEVTVEPAMDAGLAMVATNSFDALLFVVPEANASALFQITSLTMQAPRLPVLVIGPSEDDTYLAEAVFSGAQEYLGREQLSADILGHAIHCSIARQQERLALIEEKNNYYDIFDHLVEGIFRTTVTAAICWPTSPWPAFTATTRRWNSWPASRTSPAVSMWSTAAARNSCG